MLSIDKAYTGEVIGDLHILSFFKKHYTKNHAINWPSQNTAQGDAPHPICLNSVIHTLPLPVHIHSYIHTLHPNQITLYYFLPILNFSTLLNQDELNPFPFGHPNHIDPSSIFPFKSKAQGNKAHYKLTKPKHIPLLEVNRDSDPFHSTLKLQNPLTFISCLFDLHLRTLPCSVSSLQVHSEQERVGVQR